MSKANLIISYLNFAYRFFLDLEDKVIRPQNVASDFCDVASTKFMINDSRVVLRKKK